MPAPKPQPVDPDQLPQLALATMKTAKFPMLATMDGKQPRVRPVSPVKTEGFVVYVANLRSYHKTGELEQNPLVELCYLDAHHNQVRITAASQVVTDRALIEGIWAENPLLKMYLGASDNPEFILYKLTPQRVRYMREWALQYFEVPIDFQK